MSQANSALRWCRFIVAGTVAALFIVTPSLAQVGDWPDVFDPFTLHELHLSMDPSDWNTIQNDNSFSIEVPADFWADGETPILVGVRRKSATPLRSASGFDKVSLKIDINQFIVGQKWHGLTKLSLENGDDQDVVSEGVGWGLHRLASGPEGYGYQAGLANWVVLHINGVNTGVYVSVEQRNKQFLRNRGLYVAGDTWLYKFHGIDQPRLDFGTGVDPTFEALCYSPFDVGGPCATPDNATLAADLPNWVNMQGLLTEGMLDGFLSSGDSLFAKNKNYFLADFRTLSKRQYYPWDLDAVLPGGRRDLNIYDFGQNNIYQQIILNVPEFRDQFSRIANDLLCGPMSLDNMIGFIDAIEPVLAAALNADVNSKTGGNAAGHFDSVRSWLTRRIDNVVAQIEGYEECDSSPPCPGDLDGDADVDLTDLSILLSEFGMTGGGLVADIDGDGDVDLSDLAALLSNFATVCE